MSNTTKTVLAVLFVGLFISLFLYQCNTIRDLKAQAILDAKTRIHDTSYLPFYPMDTSVSKIPDIIPNHQINYDSIPKTGNYTLKCDTTINNPVLILYRDSIAHDTVKLPFLTEYPYNKKLILGKFDRSSVRFDLLGIDGKMESKFYYVDYSRYRYEFVSNQLRSFDTLKTSTNLQTLLRSFNTESYLYTTYNPFYKGADIKLDYSLMYKNKIGVTAFGQFSTYQSPILSAGIGIKAKIK